MTHKDGYTFCNFCGSHESRVTFLVAGQRDTHICDCCAWDCAMLIYEKMKDRYNGEQTDTVMEKPLTAATVKGPKGKKRNGVSAWPVTILDTPAQLPALGGRGSTAWPPRLRGSSTEPSAWAWKCSLSSSPSTSPPSPNR